MTRKGFGDVTTCQAQTHTLPTVVRMDIMARRVGPGKVGPFPAGGYWWSISQGGMVDDF